MNSCQFENIPVWSKVGKIIGWIGIAIAIVGIPLLCYSYGIETIVYAMIHKYGLYFTKVWVVILSFSYVLYLESSFIWLWAIQNNKDAIFMIIPLVCWSIMFSLLIRLTMDIGSAFGLISILVFFSIYYTVAVMSCIQITSFIIIKRGIAEEMEKHSIVI